MAGPEPADSESALGSITRGASLYFVGRLLSNVLKFLVNILLTRGLGASLYGIYAFARTVILILRTLAKLGSGKALLRFIPSHEENPRRRNEIIGLAYLTAFAGSTALAVGLYALAPTITARTLENPLLTDVLRIFALVLPFNSVIQLTNAAFRGLEKLEYQILVSNIVEPIVQLVVVAVALWVGYSLLGVAAGLAIAVVLVWITAITLLYFRTEVRPDYLKRHSRTELVEFYNYSAPLTLKDLGSILYTRVDILMVGIFLIDSDVGIYQVAILIAGLLTLPLTGFNQLFPPIASRLYTDGKLGELESIYATITRWSLTIAIPLALVTLIYPAEVLRVFGPEFTDGVTVLALFTIAHLTNCAVGPSGFLLMMTDHQYLNLLNQWTLGVLNVVLNYYLILEFGLIGAALATAGTLTLINLVRVAEVWYTERLTPYSTSFWKPIVAGIVAGAAMYGIRTLLDGYLLLVIGGALGAVLFGCLLLLFGIEEDDREFFNDFVLDKLS